MESYIDLPSPVSSHSPTRSPSNSLAYEYEDDYDREMSNSSRASTESSLDLARGPLSGAGGAKLRKRSASRELSVSRNTSLTSTGSIVEMVMTGKFPERDPDQHTPIIDRVLRRNSFLPTRPAPRPPGGYGPNVIAKSKPKLQESWIDLSDDDLEGVFKRAARFDAGHLDHSPHRRRQLGV